MALTPTIRVGRELIWLDADALAKDEVKLDRESISEQCEGCGRDILESGQIRRAHGVTSVECDVCCEAYEVVLQDVT
jgi:hypothetical protein